MIREALSKDERVDRPRITTEWKTGEIDFERVKEFTHGDALHVPTCGNRGGKPGRFFGSSPPARRCWWFRMFLYRACTALPSWNLVFWIFRMCVNRLRSMSTVTAWNNASRHWVSTCLQATGALITMLFF